MADDAQKYVDQVLDWAQRTLWVRQLAAGLVVVALLGFAGNFVYQLLPRQYSLTITGGELVSTRHQFARILQDQARHQGIELKILPTVGSDAALSLVNSGKLDLALVLAAGDRPPFSHVQHVSSIAPEILHALVKPEIKGVKDIRGKTVNIGHDGSAVQYIGQTVLKFSGFDPGIDFFESKLTDEQLILTRADRLPDVVLDISMLPSFLAEFLVRERDFQLLELPFPNSLALRMGWVAQAQIPGYTYGIDPPVPPGDITTVGARLNLVANDKVEPHAIFQLLTALYSPSVAGRARIALDESHLGDGAEFPQAQGATDYLNRNNPLLSQQTVDKLKNWFGLVMSIVSTGLIVLKWFKGPAPKAAEPETDDDIYRDHIRAIAAIEIEAQAAAEGGSLTVDSLNGCIDRLSSIRRAVLDHYPSANLKDPSLVTVLLMSLDSTHQHLKSLSVRVAPAAV